MATAPYLLLTLVLLTGCSAARTAAPASAPTGIPGSLIVEPQAGPAPYLNLVNGAGKEIDVNSYLLTDRDLVTALVARARAGLSVRVIVPGNPYHDQKAVTTEREEFAGTPVQFQLAPARFERPYTFDHAKYIVVDPGRPQAPAILGSSNLDYSGLGGGNREFDFATTAPGVVASLAAVFAADWAGRSLQPDQPGALVVSPGSEGALVGLIEGASTRLYIESEEMGNDRAVLDAVAADARRGVRVEVVLPGSLSAGNRRNAEELSKAGAGVRYLDHPYPHAKLIIADDRLFLGSQNISVSSLDRNREAGIVVRGNLVDEAVGIFGQDYQAANPR